MKKIFLLTLLLSSISGAFAQETTAKPKKGPLVMPPYFGIFTRIEGQSSFGNNYNTMLSTSGIEIFLGKNKLYFYAQVYFQYDIGRNTYYVDEIIPTSPYAVGNLIGMGGYLFDKRASTGTGWSMVMNGGGGIRVYFPEAGHKNDGSFVGTFESFAGALALFTSFTLEINTSVRYHTAQNFGLQFGGVIGMDFIAPRQGALTLRYGLSFGMVF